jgi:hypothetical protein
LDRVRQAVPGNRHDTIRGAAFSLGQLIGGGLLQHDEVRTALLLAAESVGSCDRKTEDTILSGLRVGAAHPRGGVA